MTFIAVRRTRESSLLHFVTLTPHALNLQERTLVLRAVPCFQSATVQALALMAASAPAWGASGSTS